MLGSKKLIPRLSNTAIVIAMNEATAYFEQFEQGAAPLAGRGVLAWLYWLHYYIEYWLGLSYQPGESVQELGFACAGTRGQQGVGNRHRRRVDERFDRNAFPSARNLKHFRTLLPRGLSHTQYLERRSRVSISGRVFVYRIPNVVPLHRRMLHTRLTRGWRGAAALGRLFGRLLRALLAGLWIGHLRPN